MDTVDSYNVEIWVGLRAKYTDFYFNVQDVANICNKWVNEVKDCVTITKTQYHYVNGWEPGVKIGYINYPRFPRTKEEILKRALDLAERLRVGLKQNRVTVTTPDKTYMLGNEN